MPNDKRVMTPDEMREAREASEWLTRRINEWKHGRCSGGIPLTLQRAVAIANRLSLIPTLENELRLCGEVVSEKHAALEAVAGQEKVFGMWCFTCKNPAERKCWSGDEHDVDALTRYITLEKP